MATKMTRSRKPSAGNGKVVVVLDWEKETKGTHVYGSDNDGDAINKLYVKKDGMDKAKRIRVSVESA